MAALTMIITLIAASILALTPVNARVITALDLAPELPWYCQSELSDGWHKNHTDINSAISHHCWQAILKVQIEHLQCAALVCPDGMDKVEKRSNEDDHTGATISAGEVVKGLREGTLEVGDVGKNDKTVPSVPQPKVEHKLITKPLAAAPQYIPGTTLDYTHLANQNLSGHLETLSTVNRYLASISSDVLRAEAIQNHGFVSGQPDNDTVIATMARYPGYHWEIVQKVVDLQAMLQGYYEMFDMKSGLNADYDGEYCGPGEILLNADENGMKSCADFDDVFIE